MYAYYATVEKVRDGDTVELLVDCGFEVYHHIAVRFKGVNAPELKDAGGKESKAWVAEHLPIGKQVVIQTFKAKAGAYNRYTAVVYLDASVEMLVKGGTDLVQELVKSGHAKVSEYKE